MITIEPSIRKSVNVSFASGDIPREPTPVNTFIAPVNGHDVTFTVADDIHPLTVQRAAELVRWTADLETKIREGHPSVQGHRRFIGEYAK